MIFFLSLSIRPRLPLVFDDPLDCLPPGFPPVALIRLVIELRPVYSPRVLLCRLRLVPWNITLAEPFFHTDRFVIHCLDLTSRKNNDRRVDRADFRSCDMTLS